MNTPTFLDYEKKGNFTTISIGYHQKEKVIKLYTIKIYIKDIDKDQYKEFIDNMENYKSCILSLGNKNYIIYDNDNDTFVIKQYDMEFKFKFGFAPEIIKE